MTPERLASMARYAVALDTETHLGAPAQPGLAAPPPVCGSIAWCDPSQSSGMRGELLRAPGKVYDDALGPVREAFVDVLRRDEIVIVGANISYDFLVLAVDAAKRGIDLMPGIFGAFNAGRVFDVQRAEELHAVGRGTMRKDPRTGGPLRDPVTGETQKVGYRLDVVVDLVLGRNNAKANDFWRKRYALLEGVPVEQWPAEARIYPVDDAINTLEVALAQVGHRPNVGPHAWVGRGCVQCGAELSADVPLECTSTYRRMNLHEMAIQSWKAWCLHLAGAWGLRTDPVYTEALIAAAEAGRAAALPDFVARGWLNPDGSGDEAALKRAVAIAYGCTGHCGACVHYYARYGRPGKRPGNGKKPPRHKACGGQGCADCDGTGKLPDPINCPDCDGTGLDLTTAPVPRNPPSSKTPNGSVRKGGDILLESGDDALLDYAYASQDDKVIDTYGPWLRGGYEVPITLSANPILETARVSYRGTAQTLPRQISARLLRELKRRGLQILGVRDCVIPRDGWIIFSNDYTGGELVTHAESCKRLVGYSEMGQALIAGMDVHCALAATMLGVSYDDFMRVYKDKSHPDYARYKAFRQAAKPGNFGFPGRMGPARMVFQQRGDGPDTEWPDGPHDLDGNGKMGYVGTRFCLLIGGAQRCGAIKIHEYNRRPTDGPVCRACVECAAWIRREWIKRWSENEIYLEQVVPAFEEQGWVEQHYSRRIRGGVDGGSIANGFFQAFLADITARAFIRVATESWVRTRVTVTEWPSQFAGMESPLFGACRPEVFAHDEIYGESVISVGPEVSERVNEIMVEEFKRACPNHAEACKAEPTIMPRWYKAAEQRRHCPRCLEGYDGEFHKRKDGAACGARGRLIAWEPK